MFPSALMSSSFRISSSSPFFNFSPSSVLTASFISSWLIFPSPSRSNYRAGVRKVGELKRVWLNGRKLLRNLNGFFYDYRFTDLHKGWLKLLQPQHVSGLSHHSGSHQFNKVLKVHQATHCREKRGVNWMVLRWEATTTKTSKEMCVFGSSFFQ